MFNAKQLVPYKLPDNKTVSTWKSDSSPGGGGYNEIKYDDKAGAEVIYVQAQRELHKLVKHDEAERTKRDKRSTTERHEHTVVKGVRRRLIESDDHLHVKMDQRRNIDGTLSMTVKVDRQEVVGNDYALEAGEEIHLKAGMTMVIEAGMRFLVRVVADDLRAGLPPPPLRWRPPAPELVALREKALEALRAEAERGALFGVFDAARDRRIKALVDACEDESRSLFEGAKGDLLAEVAPYLVKFEKRSALLEVVVKEGWGDSWGVYLTGRRPFVEVRQRLRRSLMVHDEETNKELYFRFYDPRVLRAFWPTCSPRQRSEVLGTEIGGFVMEGHGGELLQLAADSR